MQDVRLRPYSVKRRISRLVHRNLSPKTFLFARLVFLSARFWWWLVSSFFPRVVASYFVKYALEVRCFSTEENSSLMKQLQNVNALAPTKMCRVMTNYGSDKGRPHNYTIVYSTLFRKRCDKFLRIFELGLGTNNPDAPSNMGVFGLPGASLRGWRDLFPHALIYGADIDRAILFQEDRIKTFYCDQLDRSSIRELWSNPELRDGMDIIVEDGMHTFEANVFFLEESLRYLRPGGIYITEDIMACDKDKWASSLENIYSKQYPEYEFAYIVLPNCFSHLLVVCRNAG